jgi:hypothetical protein
MKIYIAHSRSFNFEEELYVPLKNSFLVKEHLLVFPHDESNELFNTKQFFRDGCDLVLAEVSYPSIGLGIELGWANLLNVPVVCMYKKNTKMSGSLKEISDQFIEYSDLDDLITKIKDIIQQIYKK